MKPFLVIFAVLLVPIIPFVLFGSQLEPAIKNWLETADFSSRPMFGSFAVVSILASDIFLPVPSSFVGTFAGNLLGTFLGSVSTWIGLNLSCLIGYWTAAKWGPRIVKKFADERAVTDILALNERFGKWLLIGFRPVPVLAEASVLLAGLGKMNPFHFWPSIIGSNLGLSIAYAALGDYASKHGWLGLAMAISVAVPMALLFGWLVARRRGQN